MAQRARQGWVPDTKRVVVFPEGTFGERLRLIRVATPLDTHEQMSQREAAEKAGIGFESWNKWERGLHTPSNMADAVAKISAAFGVDPGWLMWGPSPPRPGRPRRTDNASFADRTGELVAA